MYPERALGIFAAEYEGLGSGMAELTERLVLLVSLLYCWANKQMLLSMGILQVGDVDFLNRFKPAQKLECFHFEQNSPNKVKLVQKN